MRSSRSQRTHHSTLRAQADVPHTFGTLLIPLAMILVAGGGYQLEGTIAHPLQSDAASILFGSVTLACGLLLVTYLLRSVRLPSHPSEQTCGRESAIAAPAPTSTKPLAKETPRVFRTHYVDGARISR
jgi:hypothetical protein